MKPLNTSYSYLPPNAKRRLLDRLTQQAKLSAVQRLLRLYGIGIAALDRGEAIGDALAGGAARLRELQVSRREALANMNAADAERCAEIGLAEVGQLLNFGRQKSAGGKART